MKFSHNAVVELVEYPYYEHVDQDDESGEDRVLIMVLMPSGQDSRKIEVKIHNGGLRMSIFEVYPDIFLDSSYVRKQCREITSSNTAKMKGFSSFITTKLLKFIHRKHADKVLKEMQVVLPFPCEEHPTSHNRQNEFNEDEDEDRPVVLFEHDDPDDPHSDQKAQVLYIELVGKKRKERSTIGRASEWRDETDSEDEEEEESIQEEMPVFNNSTKKAGFHLVIQDEIRFHLQVHLILLHLQR